MNNDYKASLRLVIDETAAKKEFAKFTKNFARQKIDIKVQLDKNSLSEASKEIQKLEYDSGFSEMYITDFEHFSELLVSIKDQMKDLKGISLNSNMEMLDKLNDLSGLKNLQSEFKALPSQVQKATSEIDKFANQTMTSLTSLRATNVSAFTVTGSNMEFFGQSQQKKEYAAKAMNNYNAIGSDSLRNSYINKVTENDAILGAHLKALNGAPAIINAYNSAITASTMKTFALTVASSALNAAITMGVGIAIQAIIAAVTFFAKEVDKVINRFKYAKEELGELTSNIASINKEISKNQKTVSELEQIKNPTLTDEKDLKNLQEINKELEIEIQFLEQREKITSKEVREGGEKEYNQKFGQQNLSESNINRLKNIYSDKSKYIDPANMTDGAYDIAIQAQQKILSDFEKSDPTAWLLAQYKFHQEAKALALQNNDTVKAASAQNGLDALVEPISQARFEMKGLYHTLKEAGSSDSVLDPIKKSFESIDTVVFATDRKLTKLLSKLSDIREQELFDLFNSGKLTNNDLETKFSSLHKFMLKSGLTINDLKSKLEEFFAMKGQTSISVSVSDTISELDKMDGALSKASSVYTDLQSNKKITNNDNVSNLSEDFGKLDGFDSFISTLYDPKSNVEDMQNSLKGLISEFVNFSGVLKDVDAKQKNLIVTRLESMGVVDAETIVNNKLESALGSEALAKEFLADTSGDLSDANYHEINQFLEISGATEIAKIAFAQLALGKDELNGKAIVTSGDIQSLIDLATQAHATKASIDRLRGIQQVEENIKKGVFPSIPDLVQYGKDKYALSKGKTGLEYEPPEVIEFKPPPPPKIPKRSGSNNSKPKEFSNNIDWAKQSVETLESALSSLQTALDNTNLSFEDQNKLLNESIAKQTELTNAYHHSSNVYQAEWDHLKSKIPKEYAIKIQSGEAFAIEQFTNEESYKNIQAATSAYKQLEAAKQNLSKETKKGLKLEKEIYELRQKNLDSQLDILNNSKQNILNTLDEFSEIDQAGTEKQYQALIESSKQEENLQRQKLEELLQRQAALTPTSDEYYEAAKEIQKCRDALSDCKQEQLGWTKNMMELPINQLEKANQKLQRQLEILSKQQAEYDHVIRGVIAGIDEEIKSINTLKTEKQDELELFQKSNEERERQLALEQAQYNFERAKNQKSVKILKNGEFVYEADQDALKSGKEELDKLEYDRQVQSMQDAVDLLDDEISKLEEIKTAWTDIADSIERMNNIAAAGSLLGRGWKDNVLSGDEKSFNYVTMLYGSNASNRESLESQIEINDELIMQINDYIAAWQDGELSVLAALAGISETVQDTAGELAATDQRIQSVAAYSNIWQGASNQIQAALGNMNASQANTALEEKATLDQRIVNMTDFSVQFAAICQILEATALAMTGQLNNSVQAAANAVNTLNRLAQEAESARESIGGNNSRTADRAFGSPSYYHTGIEKGLVSRKGTSNANDRENMLHFLSTKKLNHDEIPIIAKIGEAIFNEDQQNILLSNMTGFITPTADHLIKSPVLSKLHPGRPSEVQVQFSIGDINLENVQDPNGLANALYTQFQPCLQQKMADIFNR